MKKGKYLLSAICILSASIVFEYCSGLPTPGLTAEVASGKRADVINIDVLKTFGGLERPPVQFLHDAHTRALAKKNMDCTACHLTENGRIYPKFERLTDTDKITVTNTYHQKCIACHGKLKIANEKAGPVECEGCHTEKARFASSRQPMGFDKSLHFRHSESQDNKCEHCHHEYNEKTKTLFYAKGQQETCRYCHGSETQGNRISMGLASHLACIDCHRKYRAKNLAAGPVECAGCHDAAAQRKIEKVASVPRMQGKQPDIVLLKSAHQGMPADIEKLNRMNFVPFDHKAHETYTDTCRGCHHESLRACTECHTPDGTKQGGGINLEQAMHQLGTQWSCKGCHAIQQRDQKCAGCHDFMSAGRENQEASCSPCHLKPVPEKGTSNPEQDKALAAEMLRSRTPAASVDNRDDIPDTVVIKNLSDQYEAVVFPHRRIVNALAADVKGSQLAAYFHTQPGTLCQGCHHNSPISDKPPLCGSCHGQLFDSKNPLKPGIKGAYHLQCMGCHKAMGIKKPAECVDCHQKKSSRQ
jgi:Class III cytochrome C family